MLKKSVTILIVILVLGAAGVIIAKFYPFLFARTVKGTIIGVTKVNPQSTIIGSGTSISNAQMFSFAVAIKDTKDGEIVTGSSEDRQWAVAREGLCAEAKFFPYPPWELANADTYFNVRLIKLYDCPGAAVSGTPQLPTNSPRDVSPPTVAAPSATPVNTAPTPAPAAGRVGSGAPHGLVAPAKPGDIPPGAH
jgi:hypothetical protein